MRQSYFVKLILPSAVYRFGFARWQIAGAMLGLLALVVVAAVGMGLAHARVQELSRLTAAQEDRLTSIGRETQSLDDELHRLQAQNQQIRRLIGADGGPRHSRAREAQTAPRRDPAATQTGMRTDGFDGVAGRVRVLKTESDRTRDDSDRLHRLALRILNIRRFDELVRARVVAGIPSIDPVEGSVIASTFGWRLDPWPSFHEGVDLDADYGRPVRASAAGTVVAVGWDGGFGLKVDIDHGNGYHTWYAHLSRTSVQAGQYVRKAENIAFVGDSGDATGPHLHYEVLQAGHAIDPAPFLSGVPPKVLAALK